MSYSTQLRLERLGGYELEDCAEDMVRVAKLLEVEVVLSFQDIELRATKFTGTEEVCAEFYAKRERERSRLVRETLRKNKSDD